MAEQETSRTHESDADYGPVETGKPDWQARGDEHPLEGGQTDAVDEAQEEEDDDSLADGSSYRKEADGLDDLTADGSNYQEIAKTDD